jgi:hypothetical protein
MRKLSVFLVLMVPVGLFLTAAPAQETSGGNIFSRYRQFRIPFNAGTGAGRLKQLQLFASTDQGRTWQPAATAPPEEGQFRFVADRDGYFWFTVQTKDLEGRLYPATLEGATPSLKVIIDTVPPAITLHGLAPRQGEIGLSWEIRDDNLDLAAADALRLEYRTAGGGWQVVSVPTGASQVYWNAAANGPVEVRLRARDRAGNVGEAGTTLNPANTGGFINNNQGATTQPGQGTLPFKVDDKQQQILNAPGDAERKLVGSTRISLNYELKDVGPSGVSQLELWYTQDGRSWNKHPIRVGEDSSEKKTIVFNVIDEGLYGITLVAKSGVGLGERPPQLGDRPQLWLEVDTTKPVVQLHNVLVGTGPDKGKLNITWSARDKNLGSDPISLSYAEALTGPWKSIAKDLPNTGRYIWNMPEKIFYQFHLKVEAIDRAGNIGEAVTDSLIKVDLAHPKVKILTVEPAGK